jgi:hypothetical protein
VVAVPRIYAYMTGLPLSYIRCLSSQLVQTIRPSPSLGLKSLLIQMWDSAT